MKEREVNVGILISHSPTSSIEELKKFSRRLIGDVTDELTETTAMKWNFHIEEPSNLGDDNPRRPADFLDEASLRMVEGPFDIVLVITDVAVFSRQRTVVAGLASPVSRIMVISTRKFLVTPLGKPMRTLERESVRWNAATLLLHLIGHILGMGHNRKDGFVMSEFFFDVNRRGVPHFEADERRQLKHLIEDAPENHLVGGGLFSTFLFHFSSTAKNFGIVASSVWRNRAPLLPLNLPSLATAAVAPTFILIFTAEIWDVGLGMTNFITLIFSVLSIIASVFYLTNVHSLFYPRKEKRIITEHMAVVNAVIFLTIFFAILGLFLMVGLLMLFIEVYIFPPQLINTWTTLEHPAVDIWDKVQLAIFISTVGVLTGALAGGLENRTVIRHLALFLDEP